jgi:DNA-binding transcriptional MocR family regulator
MTGSANSGAEEWIELLASTVDRHQQGQKYRVIATALEEEIRSGRMKRGDRLPTVRDLSENLKISATTASAAYRVLAQRGLITTKVGSGTRVAFNQASRRAHAQSSTPERSTAPWRRRTQKTHIYRLQTAFPEAANYASGTPNPSLLPLSVLKRAWRAAIGGLTENQLRYSGPAPVSELARVLVSRLESDLIPARATDMVIGSSAQQLLTLALNAVSELSQKSRLLVAVEEPGYPTIFDTYERLEHRLIGVQVDDEGVRPESLENALAAGADAVLVTPRAHNPTGVSWSTSRLKEIAEVVATHPGIVVIEDDQFAGAMRPPLGSLLSDPRIEDMVIYIRSFSKAIAPDLRLAVAVTRPRLRDLLMEGKFFADGWSSNLSQMALANALSDPALDPELDQAFRFYARQRQELTEAILSKTPAGLPIRISPSTGGVNVWVQLPQNAAATEVAERAAASGILVATGEPFFVRVGRDDAVRLNAGMVPAGQAEQVGHSLASAIVEATNSASDLFLQHNL